MEKSKIFLSTCVVIVAFVITLILGLVFREKGGGSFRNLSKCQASVFLSPFLSLSEEQEGKIDGMDIPFRKKVDEVCSELCKERRSLISLIKGGKLDKDELNERIVKISKMQGDIEIETVNHIMAIKATLSKEQEKKFLSALEDEFCKGCVHEDCTGACRCSR